MNMSHVFIFFLKQGFHVQYQNCAEQIDREKSERDATLGHAILGPSIVRSSRSLL